MRELKPEASTYAIERLVGIGQMAMVYKAVRRDSRGHCIQPVALKILKNRIDIRSLRLQFESLAKVNSPHCLRVLSWENLAEGSALVLEWIDGVTLFELAKLKRFSSDEVDDVVRQVADGLQALTDAGIHHGDLSPANILIDAHGCVRILDFGQIDGARGDGIRGTPAFLAPEIWEGAASSAPADLFALGLIESDLHTGSFFSSEDLEDSRRRVFALADCGHPLLHRDPALRFFPKQDGDASRSATARAEIAKTIRLCLESRLSAMQTRTISTDAPNSPKLTRLSACLTALLTTSAVALTAEAPAAHGARSSTVTLTVRSQEWRELRLNGRYLGYAPLEISGLEPGQHHLTWKTRSGSGQEYLKLRPGEHLVLGDRDWEK